MDQRTEWRAWAGLAVLSLPTLLVSIDLFVMLMALPRLSASLQASSSPRCSGGEFARLTCSPAGWRSRSPAWW
jgi:hypothetical protein